MLSGAQVHLFLNHIPILGIPFSLALLVYGLWRKSAELQKTGLGAIVLIALLTIPAFKSGESAEEIVEDQAGISETLIEAHEEAAELAFWLFEAIGVVVLVGLVLFRSPKRVPTWFSVSVVVSLLVAGGLMARVGHLGGQINHPEIRSGQLVGGDSAGDYDNDDD